MDVVDLRCFVDELILLWLLFWVLLVCSCGYVDFGLLFVVLCCDVLVGCFVYLFA